MELTTEQIKTFHTQGVLIVKNALTDEELQPVIDEISALINRRARELKATGKIRTLYENEPFEERFGLIFEQSPDIAHGLDIMHYRGPAIFEFLHNKNLLDVVESLVGSEITCNPIQHLRPTPPMKYYQNPETPSNINGVSGSAPLHQDAAVMMPEAETSEIITCWLPLGDATLEMGCMEVLPGIIHKGYLEHYPEGGTHIIPNLVPDIEPTPMVCYKGDVILMHRFTPHRGNLNLSELCRWSIDLRYQPTGQHTGRTGHPSFVVRSTSNPENILTDHAKWCQLWIDALENPKGIVMHRTN